VPRAPELKERPGVEIPESRIWLEVGVPLSRVEEKIKKEVPFVLAQEKNRKIGAPGRATYRVTRGRPRLINRGKALELQVPIDANIAVCKPFAGTCIRYGRCKPSFLARFTFPTSPDARLNVPAPRGSIRATKRCIIGLDVTKRLVVEVVVEVVLEKMARSELRVVEAQIRKQWPQLRPLISEGFAELRHPFPISSQGCATLRPSGLAYVPPSIEKSSKGSALVGALGLSGKLLPTKDCHAPVRSARIPKAKSTDLSKAETTVWVPHHYSDEELFDFFSASFSGSWGGAKTNDLRVEKLQIGAEKVALHLRASGDVCGPLIATGSIALSEDGKELVFSLDTLSPEQGDTKPLRALRSHLDEKSVVHLDGVSPTLAKLALDQMTSRLDPEIRLAEPTLLFGQPVLQLARDGTHVLYPVSTRLRITDY